MRRKAEIEVRRSGEQVSLIVSAAGGPAKVIMIALFAESQPQPLWWLTSEAFAPSFPLAARGYLSMLEGRLAEQAGAPGRGDPDSWSDLVADDPANRELGGVSFGYVPPGFRQAFPAGAPPQPLESGKTYRVVLFGETRGEATFVY